MPVPALPRLPPAPTFAVASATSEGAVGPPGGGEAVLARVAALHAGAYVRGLELSLARRGLRAARVRAEAAVSFVVEGQAFQLRSTELRGWVWGAAALEPLLADLAAEAVARGALFRALRLNDVRVRASSARVG